MASLGEKNNIGINIDVRSKILEYSLIIEGAINSLLLCYLGITEKSKTKLFGSKAGISFKSKIDLLYDIDVLSKNEHSDLELQMIFRNKFIHALECNSFLVVLSQLDNGIKNKFKKHMKDISKINNEYSCKETYGKIYSTNLNVILKNIELKIQSVDDKADLIKLLLKKEIRVLDISFDFIKGLLMNLDMVALQESENEKIVDLIKNISSKCEKHMECFSIDKHLNELSIELNRLLDKDKINEYIK